MSEIGLYRTRLNIVIDIKKGASALEQDPLFQMLRRAMEIVAERHCGELTQKVKDRFGRETACDIAIKIPEFPLGLGIQVDRRNGAVDFTYDRSGFRNPVVQKIRDEIVQNYTALAVIRAMKSLGYEVMEEPRGQDVVALVGVLR